ncbi:MAG: phosphoenolpyruvate carboxykinase (ATP) [Myxococcota bacterium]
MQRNLSFSALIEEAIKRQEGLLSNQGVFVVKTGKYTGRSPNDKFTVEDDSTRESIWWGPINQKMTPEKAQKLYERLWAYLQTKDYFVQDLVAGASEQHRLKIQVINERAWHSAFARNMFLHPSSDELKNFVPEFTVIQAPGFKSDPERDGTRSEVAVVLDFSAKRILICGSEYAGETKKSVFTLLNYLLPAKGVMGMHCSANMAKSGDVAIFFGLSGTGKTTLSADPHRDLIGDDEHGWDESGVFNFEGGCYAKVIRLSRKDEPEIFRTTHTYGTLLENVVIDPVTRDLNLDSDELTENTRASYDISQIPHAYLQGVGGHPKHIIMLTCDAFGVLPPIAKLTKEQAMYHFINGYTARVAGTERGVKEPTAVFSACFGAPFMARPSVYGKLLVEKIEKHGVQCWLVNTGWSGGPYGVGNRMKISWTRGLLEAALSGELQNADFVTEPFFNLAIPRHVEGIPAEVLDPKKAWSDPSAYDAKAAELQKLFKDNYEGNTNLR